MSDFKTVNLTPLTPGTRVRLADGAVAEVTENPQDGTWLICRYIEHPTAPELVNGREQPIFATDIESLA
ncbi:hypothetical protein [Bordetella petrii]|uniref:Uncharacterized protein n=1 Tax=Bordetella petrii TaxID=94624 RepID=A0ABT7VX57_9BORD|nr:hypothetical protein [Bordetella petrii]MDM9557511.1 hypothetical protein [Bordetella petrii]